MDDFREEMNKLNSDIELSELMGWMNSVVEYTAVEGNPPPTFLDDWVNLSDEKKERVLFIMLGMILGGHEPPDPIPALVPA